MKTPPRGLAERLMAASPEILDAAAEVRLEDIAANIGAARTTLYYYFSGRDALVSFLLSEHLRHAAQVIERATAGDGSPGAKLRSLTVALIDFLSEHPGLCAGLLGSLGRSGRMDEALQAQENLVAALVRDLVVAGIASGEVRDGDARYITNALLGGILFVVLARATRRNNTPGAEAPELADQLLRGPLVDQPSRSRPSR